MSDEDEVVRLCRYLADACDEIKRLADDLDEEASREARRSHVRTLAVQRETVERLRRHAGVARAIARIGSYEGARPQASR